MRAGFDWPGLMRAGMQRLGLRPAEFWRLTPAELRLMLGESAAPSMARSRLEELAAAWPDRAARDGTGHDWPGPGPDGTGTEGIGGDDAGN